MKVICINNFLLTKINRYFRKNAFNMVKIANKLKDPKL